jgi:8-oxo-dGTP diphosphatase
MRIHLVRHALAGSRGEWDGPDRDRPLTAAGMQQAKTLAERLASAGARHVVSSPFLRCLQTVQPLADALSIAVEEEPSLAEGSPPDPIAARLDRFGDGTVLCSHGDVMEALIGYLAASGAPVDPAVPFRKAATWELDLEGSRVVSARYVPPPAP